MKSHLLLVRILVLLAFFMHQVLTKSIPNSSSKSPSSPVMIPVSVPVTKGPPILNEVIEKAVMVQARANVEIKCPIGGDPPSIYEWYKLEGSNDGERIDDSWDRFYRSPNDPHLKIRSVTHEDSGIYLCKAINGFGQLNAQIQLSVIGDDPFKDNLLKSSTSKRSNQNGIASSPEILIEHLPKEKVLKKSKGENLLLKCEAKGNPRPSITWLKDNQVLVGSRDNVSSLKVTNMSEGSSGIYRCEASNIFGISKYEVQVEVTGSWIGKAEILRLSPTNLTLFPGESGNITCVARFESASHPMFVWVKKLSEPLDPESKKIVYHKSEPYEVLSRPEWNERGKYVFTTDLILTNVSTADTGSYHCVVYGLMGYIHSEAQVYVQDDRGEAQVQSVKLNKEKEATVRWIVLWASGFLLIAVLLLVCYVRLRHGCHQKPKKRVPVLRTPLPMKSPDETVSTTLTHNNEVFQGLLDESVTPSCSASAQRVDRSMRCSSGLSELPESDVTDVLPYPCVKRSRTRRPRKSPYPNPSDIYSYRYFPRGPRPRRDYFPDSSTNGSSARPSQYYARPKNSGNSRHSLRSNSHTYEYPDSQEEFSDMDMFPSSASAYYQPANTRESGNFSSYAPTVHTTTSKGIQPCEFSARHYFQPPCSPVSNGSCLQGLIV